MKRLLLAVLALGWLASLIGLALAFKYYARPQAEATHYHANFALFVNGNRFDLSGDRYMEAVAACSLSKDQTPAQRAHLHDNNQDVIHIHAAGVTWGYFLSNLGMASGSNFFSTGDGTIYREDEHLKITYILNGSPVTTIANTLIKSTDRLLINIGPELEKELGPRYASVASSAAEYNSQPDPASCSGNHAR